MEKAKNKKIKQAINLIEELSWLLERNNIKLREIPEILRDIINNDDNVVSNKYKSNNPNKNYLIGILPNLFQDQDLFKTNSELIEFSTKILKVPISRPDKRSRYELIGLIVCEVRNLNDYDLDVLVEALAEISTNEDKLKKIKEDKKKSNFSWNDAIYEISKNLK